MKRWAEALAEEYPANAVNFDSILPGEAAALKDTPITVALPRYAKPLSLPKPVGSPLPHSTRLEERFKCGYVCVSSTCLRTEFKPGDLIWLLVVLSTVC